MPGHASFKRNECGELRQACLNKEQLGEQEEIAAGIARFVEVACRGHQFSMLHLSSQRPPHLAASFNFGVLGANALLTLVFAAAMLVVGHLYLESGSAKNPTLSALQALVFSTNPL